jgi:hypothetical protein
MRLFVCLLERKTVLGEHSLHATRWNRTGPAKRSELLRTNMPRTHASDAQLLSDAIDVKLSTDAHASHSPRTEVLELCASLGPLGNERRWAWDETDITAHVAPT